MVERYNEITFEEWRYGNYFFFYCIQDRSSCIMLTQRWLSASTCADSMLKQS